jgi:3-oxoacyl-[acyl-carrier-protein] synthase-3
MQKAGLAIPRERWYSNLVERGNTGAASIFIMLDEFLRTHQLREGQQVLCFVPESGRFTVAFALFEVESAASGETALSRSSSAAESVAAHESAPMPTPDASEVAAPHDPANAPEALRWVLGELAAVWHDYRSAAWRTPLIRSLRDGRFTLADYQQWMAHWVPQVREGTRWMRRAIGSLSPRYGELAALIETHAGDEQDDFMILFDDYRKSGGAVSSIEELARNPGGEALNAYLHGLASTPDPLGLLGAIYIIEGTGQRIIPALLPAIKASIDLPADAFRFLQYHGANDVHHLNRWLLGVELVLALEPTGRAAEQIVATARRTAQLYLMQFEHVKELMVNTPE